MKLALSFGSVVLYLCYLLLSSPLLSCVSCGGFECFMFSYYVARRHKPNVSQNFIHSLARFGNVDVFLNLQSELM
jgi:hypothetical protein